MRLVKPRQEFVESVMESQRVTRVNTQFIGSRMRHRSEPTSTQPDSDSVVKKPRVNAKAKQTLYNYSPKQPRSIVFTAADVHVDANPSVE